MAQRIIYKEGDIVGKHGIIFHEDRTLPSIKGYVAIRRANFICPMCGSMFDAGVLCVKSGVVTTCGCHRTTHGLSRTRNYNIWRGVKNRCFSENNISYPDYGGRGITMAEEFLDVKTFVAYIESLPRKEDQITLDRIDNDGNYEPGNIRWASYKEQALNKRPVKESKYIYKAHGSWNVRITYKYNHYYIGNYKKYEDAVIARNEYVTKNNLPYALI